jgi:hypothetical protein
MRGHLRLEIPQRGEKRPGERWERLDDVEQQAPDVSAGPVRADAPRFHLWTLIGLSEDDAQRSAMRFGCSIRVVSEDGREALPPCARGEVSSSSGAVA